MKKLLVVAALLLGGLCAFGQNKAPANLVDVVVTNFDVIDMSRGLYVAPTSRTFNTAQHVFDAIDDELYDFLLDPSGWNYLLDGSGTNFVHPQPVANWIDENWGVPTDGWSNLAPTNSFGVAGEASPADVFNWLDANWIQDAAHVLLNTNALTNMPISPLIAALGTNTVQAGIQAIDMWGGQLQDVYLPANYVSGTNLFSFDYDPSNKTWYEFRLGCSAQSDTGRVYKVPSGSLYYNYSWAIPFNYLSNSFEFTANSNLFNNAFAVSNAQFTAGYPGAYFVSVGASFVCTNVQAALFTNVFAGLVTNASVVNFPVGVGVYHVQGGGAANNVQYGQLADMSVAAYVSGSNSAYADVSLGRIIHMDVGDRLGCRYYTAPPSGTGVDIQSYQFDALYIGK